MNKKIKKEFLNFITMIVAIYSITYWINSILIYGFNQKPISIFVGLMIIFAILSLRNLNINKIEDLSYSLFKKEQNTEVYIIYILNLLFVDLAFLGLTYLSSIQ